MKIAITGTHSSGKTTLARLCSECFGLKFVRGDTVRQILEQYFPGKSLTYLTKKEHWELESLVLSSRIRAEKDEISFISDGCTLNSIAYIRAKLGESANKIKGFDGFCNLAASNAKNYDFIIYIPPEIPLADDSFRSLNKEFRLLVDRIIFETLKDYKFYLVSGSPEERLHQIESIIKNT